MQALRGCGTGGRSRSSRRTAGRGPLLLATALAALPGLAAAQVPQGFYVAAGIGLNIPQDATVEARGAAANRLGNSNGEIRFNALPMGTLALGYGFGNGIRVELEASLRANTVDSANGFAAIAPLRQAQGQLWQVGVMGNAYLDFNVGENAWIQPYVGAGLGYVYSDWRDFRIAGTGAGGAGTPVRLAVDSGDGNLAYQAIVGAAFPIAAIPAWRRRRNTGSSASSSRNSTRGRSTSGPTRSRRAGSRSIPTSTP
jgi:opacity protein-like surface antigen